MKVRSIPSMWNSVPLLDAGALTIIGIFWWHQARAVGSLYDYGLVIQGAYGIEQGLWPHRDFTCSLQIFTFLWARLFEILFGARYLSLGLSNLGWALITFFGIRYAMRPALGKLSTVVAFCLTIATVLQHGIIWYNSLGSSLFLLETCLAARIVAEKPKAASILLFLAFGVCLGMTKINFHLCAWACGAALFLDHALRVKSWKIAARYTAILGFVLVAGWGVEIVVSGSSLAKWYFDVIEVGRYRSHILWGFLDSPTRLYTLLAGTVLDLYPAPLLRGIPGLFLLFYAVAWLGIEKKDWRVLLFLVGVFMSTVVSICSNFDIIILRSSIFTAGLLALVVRELGNVRIRRVAVLGCVYLGVIAIPSIGKHSRLAFEPMNEPFTDGAALHPYFVGAKVDAKRTLEIQTGLAVLRSIRKEDAVYFGPGTNYFYRLFGSKMFPQLPLWWDSGTAYTHDQIGFLKEEFFSHHFVAITYNEWGFAIPAEIHAGMKGLYRATTHEAKHLNILFSNDFLRRTRALHS